ncbi:hypothetical protein M407DRAFT_234114 [Tulasnella calospora MUT 4182]|uniref:WSC domain-containing protein n=1 Tax=Tulasnella calospora MUT 4182 TaxID=1051891 RepID=A0A0C3Q9U0_9AGAM|nr:hypothetical protein M407DRAFT_234114 [Tulasnella calospora MUT 4182]
MPPSHLLLVLLCLPLALAYPTSFNRFTFRSSPNVSPSVITPRASSAPAGWTYMGCFKDSPSRILSTKVTTSSSNTPTSCLALCTKSGFQYGGSEFGNECWCGNTLTSPIARPESDCNLPCSGDNTQTCGGSLALALYQVASTTTADLAYQGCYVDTSSPSRLLTSLSFTSKLMTPTMCKSTCLANGYLWYGLEYANQCYCATNLPTSAKKASSASECSMPCAGDSTSICGASWRLSVYGPSSALPTSFASLPSATTVGCYMDASTRLLPYSFVSDDTMTPAKCQANCNSYGYTYFGA